MPTLANTKSRLFITAGPILTALATVAIYLPMWLQLLVWLRVPSDYREHLYEASRLVAGGSISTPHMLFHVLVAKLSSWLSLNIYPAGMILLSLCVALTAGILYRGWVSDLPLPFALKVLLVPILLVVAPVSALYVVDGHLYFGYIGINVFHNPTMLILKPFALAVFWLAATFWRGDAVPRAQWMWWALPLLLVLSALAKPNFLIVFLPGLALFLLWRHLAGKNIDWLFFFVGVVLPSLLILAWQFWFTYSAAQVPGFSPVKSGIVFSPFTLVKSWSDWLLLKFILSLAFPLAVTVTMWRSVRRDPQLLLAWMIFAVGAAQTYFLMESGPRASHGNFAWSSQIALFLLFVASIAHFIKGDRFTRERLLTPAGFLCLTLFILHVLSGIALYAGEFVAPQRYW